MPDLSNYFLSIRNHQGDEVERMDLHEAPQASFIAASLGGFVLLLSTIQPPPDPYQ